MGWLGQWLQIGSANALIGEGATDVALTAVPAQFVGHARVMHLYRVGLDGMFGPIQRISMAYATYRGFLGLQNLEWFHDGNRWNNAGSNFVPPGGGTTEPVAVVADEAAWLMFARGTDQRVYVATSPGRDGNSFGNFQLLLPAPIQTDHAVTVLKHEQFQLFYLGVDRKVYTRIFDGFPGDPNGTFNEFEIPGGLETDVQPAAAAVRGGFALPSVFLFARNWDQSILWQTGLGGETWAGNWTEVSGGGKTDCALCATGFNGQLYLFATGTDYGVYVNTLDFANQLWSGWEPVPGGALTNVGVSAVTYADPQGERALYLVIRGMDQTPWFTVLS